MGRKGAMLLALSLFGGFYLDVSTFGPLTGHASQVSEPSSADLHLPWRLLLRLVPLLAWVEEGKRVNLVCVDDYLRSIFEFFLFEQSDDG